MLRNVVVAILAVHVCACAANVAHTGGARFLGAELVTERNYELGEIQTAYVGDRMIRVEDYRVEIYEDPAVEVARSFSISGVGLNRTFQEGERFRYGGTTQSNGQDYNFFIYNGQLGILFDSNGQVFHRVLNMSQGLNVFLVYSYDVDSQPNDIVRVNQSRRRAGRVGQNYEIIYSGVSGDSIRLSYREYSDDNLARQAFFQDLSYPRTAESIRFRDLLIEIAELASDSISFRVLEHEDRALGPESSVK